jgi:hypothetical protein
MKDDIIYLVSKRTIDIVAKYPPTNYVRFQLKRTLKPVQCLVQDVMPLLSADELEEHSNEAEDACEEPDRHLQRS